MNFQPFLGVYLAWVLHFGQDGSSGVHRRLWLLFERGPLHKNHLGILIDSLGAFLLL